jgi:NTP pyrophosphatase (non-canonical NTP hydrolase)
MKLNKYQKRALRTGDNVKLLEYQEGAVSTAIYPGELMYPTLGLCGEVGELVEAVRAACGHDDIEKETGDVMWYVAATAKDAGLTLAYVMGRKTFPKKADSFCWCLDDILQELTIEAGIVAENVKKTIRDDAGVLGKKRKRNIAGALRHIIYLLVELCDRHGSKSLEECCKMNLDKLQSRQERGKLTGDGDDR